MTDRSCLSIILAAGEGTRMKSATPKVLHRIAGLEMLGHVMAAVAGSGASKLALVVGHGAEAVRAAAERFDAGAETFVQESRLGTAHAVLQARPALERGYDDVLVVFGDTPLLEPATLRRMRAALAEGADVVVMGFRAQDPSGYGRLIEAEGALAAIREDRDCSAAERAITLCNGGMMAIAGDWALALLEAVGNDNAKGEFYLTDIVAVARERGLAVSAIEAPAENALGINNRAELAAAEAIWQGRRRRQMMLEGAGMAAPETVFLCHDTVIEADAYVEPNVVFGPGAIIRSGATIRAFSHIEGASVAAGATVGPYARLRPGAEIGEGAKIGNFCEIKKTRVGAGAKVPHLSYVGDAVIGEGANIGAGTITCNYDGFNKNLTEIGAGAFVGSNSSLVAPLTIGAGAYVASGSVVTDNVPEDGLAFGRARQTTREGRGRQLRERLALTRRKGEGG